MVEFSRLKPKITELPDLDSIDDLNPLDDSEAEEGEFQFVESFEATLQQEARNEIEQTRELASSFSALYKLQASIDRIAFSLSEFLRRGDLAGRSVFAMNNLGTMDDPAGFQPPYPGDVRTMANLLAQGDNRQVEEFVRTFQQNVTVNVNLSYYFKIMLLMLTFNTLLLFKWIVFDHMPEF